MAELLIIGYGNELRGDDAAGPRVAAAVAAWNLPHVGALDVHQLTPELAEPISRASAVIFVDATVEDAAPGVRVRELEAGSAEGMTTHIATPQSLLFLSKTVFGRVPRAWWITVPVCDLGFGSGMSPMAVRGIEEALDHIRALAWQNVHRAVSV